MKIPIIDKLNKKIGIDIGTANTRIWIDGAGVVVDQPTCIAIDTKNNSVLAVGAEAASMHGRVADHISVLYPVQTGEVYDSAALTTLLRVFLSQVIGTISLYNPVIMASVPVGATHADREITTRVLHSLGAGEAYTIAQPLAASIGSGVPIADASGSFVLNMGAGIIEGVIISLGSVIVSQSSRYGGNYLRDSLKLYIQKKFDLKISDSTAEEIKKRILSVDTTVSEQGLFAGQDLVTENPKEVEITSGDVYDFVLGYFEKLEGVVEELLSHMPAELAVDVIDKGLLLTGGLARLTGIEQFFTQKLGIPVVVVDEPCQVTINGIAQALEHLDLFKKSLGYQE